MNTSTPQTPIDRALIEHIAQNGPVRFDQFMQLALYHPQWGYYSQGENIFGETGDFTTAPELSPLFGHTLAQALNDPIEQGLTTLYEFGAGRGKLAAQLMEKLGARIERYVIVELSAGLKNKQAETLRNQLPEAVWKKAEWITELPELLHGIVIGNELLDSVPVRRFQWNHGEVLECHVATTPNQTLEWVNLPANSSLVEAVHNLEQKYGPWPSPYESEYAEQTVALARTLTEKLNGLCLMIDYGMGESQYYQPAHLTGHLRAHSQHIAHDNFLQTPGHQDLTAHVNFSQVLQALESAGGQLEGYISQARFLLHHGLMDLATQHPKLTHPTQGAATRQALQTLTSEAAMGQSFKAMAWCKGFELAPGRLLEGFIQHDLSHQL